MRKSISHIALDGIACLYYLKEFMNKITSLVLVATLSGCASQSTLTVVSQPAGAYITETETGKAIGTAPTVVYYDSKALTQYKDSSGCFLVKGFNAQWVSGATATSPSLIRLCGSTSGAYTYQFSRDSNAPGLEKDLDFAMRQDSVRAQQQQSQAIQNAAAIQAWSAMQAAQPKPVIQVPVTPINCTSYSLGNVVQTNCR